MRNLKFNLHVFNLLFVFFLTLNFIGFISPNQLEAKEENKKKIALLFLTRNGVNHPKVWKNLIKKHGDKFNVYLYSDNPLSDPFFDKLRIKNTIPTTWDYHIKTWQLLVKSAYRNTENYKFVYLSESCIPFKSLDEIYELLTVNDLSYVAYAGPWWTPDNPREVTGLPVEHRWGNQEWVILNRKHAQMVAKDKKVINIVSKVWIDSESYPATLFSVKNCLAEIACIATTYVNWSMPENNGAHPYHFREWNQFNHDIIKEAKKYGYLFGRKFTATFPEDAVVQIMNEK